MTKDKDEKAVIRARMARTGESYAAARAQLAHDTQDPAGPPLPASEDGEGAQAHLNLVLTAQARQAVNASAWPGSTAWHLVLALRATRGTAGRVLEDLGLPMPRYAEVRARNDGETGSAVTDVWIRAVAETADRSKKRTFVDSGLLLRIAVAALEPGDVPESAKEQADRLRAADLETLCAGVEQELGPEQVIQEESGEKPGLFERFTDRSRAVIVAAQEEARALAHNYIGTEHLLLGLMKEGTGVAAVVLTKHGLSLEQLQAEVEGVVGRGTEAPDSHIPFTPRGKTALELSLQVALELGHNYIGTEHLLLALLAEGEGVAAQILLHYGVTPEETFEVLAGWQQSRPGPEGP